jgi:hypothetical protein
LSSNARFLISPHNTYLLALKISGFTLHRPPEDDSELAVSPCYCSMAHKKKDIIIRR